MSQAVKPRNFVAQSPLMRKGGVHEKSVSAKRQTARVRLNSQLDDWQNELEFEREMQNIINARDSVDDVYSVSKFIEDNSVYVFAHNIV